jgi:hypothetical protein
MATAARNRLFRDFKKITSDPPSGINATPLEGNIMVWQAVIFGPDDTPWEGGTFSCVPARSRAAALLMKAGLFSLPLKTDPQARARVQRGLPE